MSDSEAPEPESLSIMVATDSHLGYMERDPVRGKDSFAAFEEMLLLAKQKKVDFVLLGGDLFHENKPSRRTLYRAMDILRRHCMGDEPVSFQIISEQAQNFKDRFGHVNYEDPYFSVGLPIFSIHGNHDDPTREGGVEALAALDLLHVANLVNYFGKSNKVDDVEVNPILIQKGLTKLALYGMGSMRDERLNRMWQQKKVKFLRPMEDDGGKDFFNVFVLHQNRDLGRGKKNCIHESMIPEWIDLVIWGHEHECQVEPMESLVGTFRISQPGSSVATSLCEGEAVPKHVGLLEVRGNDFRLQAVPLSQVRPFRMGEIVLNEVDGLDSKGANVDEAVGEALAREVESMVEELHKEEEELNREPPEGQEYLVEKRDQVLVRLKVEHSDFPTLNNQRFGSQFMGKVANPSDLLLFYRRRNFSGGAGEAGGAAGGKSSRPGGLSNPIRPDNLADVRVEDLVMENLETADKKLSLLLEPKLKVALEDYVYKQDAQAMSDLVKDTLEGTQKALRKEKAAGNAAMIDDAVSKMSENERAKLEAERVRSEERTKSRAKRSAGAGADAAGAGGGGGGTDPSRGNNSDSDAAGGGGRGGRGRGRGSNALSDDDIDDDDDDDMRDTAPAAAAAAATSRTSAARGGGGGAAGGARSRGRTGAAAAAAAASTSRKRGSAATAAVSRGGEDDDEEDEEEEEEVKMKAPARRGGGRGRGAPAASSQAAAIDLADSDEDDDDDDFDDDQTTSRNKKAAATTKRGSATAAAASNGSRGARAAATASSASGRRRGAATGARRASARGSGRSKVSYTEDEDSDSSEVEEVAPTRGRSGRGKSVGGGRGGGGASDSFNPSEIDDNEEEGEEHVEDEDDDSEFDVDDSEEEERGRRGSKKSKAKGKPKTKAAAPSSRSSRSARAAPPAPSRGKKRTAAAAAADTQQSEASSAGGGGGGGARKRRLPTWATGGSSGGGGRRRGRDDDDDVEEISSAVSGWGETR